MFIGTDTASVELFFNIVTYGIETFVIPVGPNFVFCVVEIFRLGLEPLCGTHLRLCLSENTDADRTGSS